MTYHSGELAVQQKAGVQDEAKALGKIVSSRLKPAALDFLRNQRLAIASTVDSKGRVWASLLTGEPGFVQMVEEQVVRIDTAQVFGDPLNENLLVQDEIGILVIDIATRRRLRLNGTAQVQRDRSLYVQTKQVYFNCPKYIQLRHLDTHITKSNNLQNIQNSDILTEEQQHWITQADTFFIASFHPESGADASHRGGNPGFIRVLNESKLVFPDYSGNNMFNTLGNLAVNPLSGLLFIDFERGRTLQVTGTAHIVWDTESVAEFAGAERLVEFQIDQVIAIAGACPLHWRFVEYSPFNPNSIQNRYIHPSPSL